MSAGQSFPLGIGSGWGAVPKDCDCPGISPTLHLKLAKMPSKRPICDTLAGDHFSYASFGKSLGPRTHCSCIHVKRNHFSNRYFSKGCHPTESYHMYRGTQLIRYQMCASSSVSIVLHLLKWSGNYAPKGTIYIVRPISQSLHQNFIREVRRQVTQPDVVSFFEILVSSSLGIRCES